MTPEEAEQIMNPFYPHDPSLATKAMASALGENVPEWMCESVVGSYFNFLQNRDFHTEMAKALISLKDPFGLNSVPYKYGMDEGIGLN